MTELPPFDATPVAAPRRGPATWVVAGVVTVAALAALAAIGAATSEDDPGGGDEPAAAASGCGQMADHAVPAGMEHRTGPIEYDASPPYGGAHNPVPLQAFQPVVTREGAPELVVEKAVHNLEHGYVVVWYGTTTTGAQLDAMRDAVEEAERRKVLVVPYPAALDAPFVLTAWGHEQPCEQADATALRAFWDAHGGPNGEAPEPNAP